MRRTLLSVLLGAAMLHLPGCANIVSMGLNLGAQAAVGARMNTAQADKCFKVRKDSEAKKLGDAEAKRELDKAGCSKS